ncbi:MAG TPA: DUF5686 family protein, partial [Bacteroidales bacterium]|nr:DUF5686 family protein [Bacteroidales bacterium]
MYATSAFSQPTNYLVKGRVKDATTDRPLAFVNIAVKGTRYGCTTDIDGRFSLKTPVTPDVLLLSYLGYETKEYKVVDPASFQNIVLESRSLDLDEVEVRPGINPAHRIIDSVMANRKINDPEKLNSFTYDSYNKFFVTAYRSSENKPELSIADTVDFERLKFEADQAAKNSGTNRMNSQNLYWKPDSSAIVSFLQDTGMVHPLIRNFLSDTVNRAKMQIAFQFLKDNPWYLEDTGIISDSSGISRETFSKITSFEGGPADADLWLNLADSLVHEPAVLKILVPAVDSLFSDTTRANNIFATTGIDTLMKMNNRSAGSGDFDNEDFSLDRQYLFLMESITQRQFRQPDLSRETVVATRTSGFQDPLFVLLATQIQSFSFYHNVIHIAKKNYINPVSRGSTSKYFFHIEDTILYAGSPDTDFIISFQPKRHTKFDGLKGVLYINSDRWAIQNVIASSARDDNVFSIKIQQQYRDIEGKQWFPDQLNTEVTINNEGVIDVEGGEENYIPIGIGRTYIKNVVLNPGLKRRNFDAVAVEVDQRATRRDSSFWNSYRAVVLTEKDRETYRFLDSLGREYHFDKYAKSFFTWKSGYMPVRFVNINLGRLLLYNQYEGLRPELDLVTNHRLSPYFNIGGYVAYGSKDRRIKYGVSAKAWLYKGWEPSIELTYKNDIAAYGVEKIE